MEAGRVVGILSERDYARKVVLNGRWSRDTAVREIMTDKVLFVRPESTLADCMAIMSAKHIRHLPVMDGDQIAGVISIGDVVRALISEQAFLITQLENYITGRNG
jgi:CBS domain-containing protein